MGKWAVFSAKKHCFGNYFDAFLRFFTLQEMPRRELMWIVNSTSTMLE
jgi:hypothetical protein